MKLKAGDIIKGVAHKKMVWKVFSIDGDNRCTIGQILPTIRSRYSASIDTVENQIARGVYRLQPKENIVLKLLKEIDEITQS